MHYACFPQGDLIRHVQYVCMTPAKFAKPDDLKLKGELFKRWQGTTVGFFPPPATWQSRSLTYPYPALATLQHSRDWLAHEEW